MTTRSVWSQIAGLDWRERLLLLEATAALSLASLAIALLPFRWLAAALESIHGRDVPPSAPNEAVRRCRWAVGATARRLPWRTVCFQKGVALHFMLRRRGVPTVLHYGLSQGQGRLSAHVWLSQQGAIILGGETAGSHICLTTFPREENGIQQASYEN